MDAALERSARTRGWIATAAVGLLGFLYFFRPIHDDDVWLHFTAGRWILEHGWPPAVDDFTCTARGVPYVDHEWLAQVVFECLRRLGGITFFRASLACAAAAAIAVAFRTILRGGGTIAAGLVAALWACLLDWHLARLRPHLLTLLLTAILVHVWIARDARLRPRNLAGFTAVIVLWANVHAAALIAPVLLALAAAGARLGAQRARARRLAVLAVAAGALLLVNPYGFDVYRYAFETEALAPLIPEWKPLWTLITDPVERMRMSPGNDFRTQVIYVGVLAAATFALAAWALRAARRGVANADPALALPAAALAVLPFFANRHDLFLLVPLVFVAITVAALARAHPRLAGAARVARWIAAAVVVVHLGRDAALRLPKYAEGAGGVFGDLWAPHEPFGAVDFVASAGLEGACMNRPPWGGYLLYRAYPRVRVSFDGRITTLGAGLYREHVEFFNGIRCEEIARRYGFDLMVAPPFLFGYGKPLDAPDYVAPDLSRDWVEVYRDADLSREGAAVVALRRGSPLFDANLARARAASRARGGG